jgi:hypothetical protein
MRVLPASLLAIGYLDVDAIEPELDFVLALVQPIPGGDQNSTPTRAVWACPSSTFSSRDFRSVHDWP